MIYAKAQANLTHNLILFKVKRKAVIGLGAHRRAPLLLSSGWVSASSIEGLQKPRLQLKTPRPPIEQQKLEVRGKRLATRDPESSSG